MNTPKTDLVCDLQFGSTGKGLLAGYLAETKKPDTVISAWMPNAGHTYITSGGRTFVHTMVPNGVVSPNLKKVMLGPGSVINPVALTVELAACSDYLQGKTVYIHHAAAVVREEHRQAESKSMTAIGSTKKGCGAALAEKIARDPKSPIVIGSSAGSEIINTLAPEGVAVEVVYSQSKWLDLFFDSDQVLVEGAQGYSLGINSGFYPYTTSRECTPAQIATDCGIPAYHPMTRYGCIRTFPIRVANRYDKKGRMVGHSGPGYFDQIETSWAAIGQEVERTTVTKLPRRVFTFSANQVKEAIKMTGVDEVFLNFVNYLEGPGHEQERLNIANAVHEAGATISYLGYGPKFDDVKEAEGLSWVSS